MTTAKSWAPAEEQASSIFYGLRKPKRKIRPVGSQLEHCAARRQVRQDRGVGSLFLWFVDAAILDQHFQDAGAVVTESSECLCQKD